MSDDTDGEETYGLVLSFDGLFATYEQERAFVLGFEFARVYGKMRAGDEADLTETVHVENRTIIERACGAEGWAMDVQSEDDCWLGIALRKVKSAKLNPHGLRIVN